jgi:hypothetical protein
MKPVEAKAASVPSFSPWLECDSKEQIANSKLGNGASDPFPATVAKTAQIGRKDEAECSFLPI